jgi:NitT/TauT family transport system permease protein
MVASIEVSSQRDIAAEEAVRAATLKSGLKGERTKHYIFAAQFGFIASLFAIWEAAARLEWIDVFFWGQPSAIVGWLVKWAADGSLLANAWVTFGEAAEGFAISVLVAVPLGVFLARNKFWGRFANPFIDIANSTPRFALAPLFVLLLGLGQTSKVVLVFSVVLFPILINTIAGASSIDPNLIRLAQLVNASRWQMIAKVIVPATAEWLIAAMRLAAPYALASAVVGEMISSNEGLGYLVVKYSGLQQSSATFAAVFMLALCGWALNAVATLLAMQTPWMRARKNEH